MGNPREKGKIPHTEWPAILARYTTGESLASIARDYHCTAPAIRYIVRRQPAGRVNEARMPMPPSNGATPRNAAAARQSMVTVGFSPDGRQNSERIAAAAGRRMELPPVAALASAIAPELHRRIASEISFFLVALDAALIHNSHESMNALHDATDRLMRATARLRIELERHTDSMASEPSGDPIHRGS